MPPRKKSNPSDAAIQVNEVGRLQPQATDFEAAVIGACLIEQDAFGLVSDILKPNSFYDSKHKTIFQAIQTLAGENKPVDMLTVTQQLRSTGELDAAGGMSYIAELSQRMTSSAHIEYHAHIIAQKALARELITYTSNIQRAAFDEAQDVAELMQTAEGQLFELSKTNLKKDFTQIDPVIDEAYLQLQKAAQRSDGLSGLASGFDKLDAVTSGWQNSDLIIIAARPAMGKTAFVLSMAKNIAVNMRQPVAMFSLEMSNVQLVNRLIVNVCAIEGSKIRSGQLAQHEWSQLDLNLDQVREHGVKLIIIDYLQLMNASGMSYNSRQEEVSTISRSLKGLAKELNIPIIALSQLNRSVESRTAAPNASNPDAANYESKRPQLSDLRESGAIEQDADMVCFIHRPEYYKIYKDAHGNDTHGIAEFLIAKHRNGEVKDIRMRFDSDFARFSNIDDAPPLPTLDENGVIQSSHNKKKTKSNSAPVDDQFGSISVDMMPGDDAPF